jgi:molecular chaperone GrpE
MTEKRHENRDPDPEPEEEPREVGDETATERLEALERETEDLLDRLKRVTAEYENYRKRIAREQLEWHGRALEGLVLDLLPVQDSFDRAIESADDSSDAASVLHGMKLVRRQLVGALERHGVRPIEAIGKPFDPQLHEAFSSRPVMEGEEPGTIVVEIEKGYVMGDRTIRATKGIVAVPAEGESPEEE